MVSYCPEEPSSKNTYEVCVVLWKGGRNGMMIYVQRCGTSEDAPPISVYQWLVQVETDPNIAHLIMSALRSWHDNSTLSGKTLMILHILDSQAFIGWRRFLKVGCPEKVPLHSNIITPWLSWGEQDDNGWLLWSKKYGILHGIYGSTETVYFINKPHN
jgi:hypothetical protein